MSDKDKLIEGIRKYKTTEYDWVTDQMEAGSILIDEFEAFFAQQAESVPVVSIAELEACIKKWEWDDHEAGALDKIGRMNINCENIRRLIKEKSFLTNQPESEWISVDDRLPSDDRIVLVEGGIARYEGGNWHSLTGINYPGRIITWIVTDWMEFPLREEL